eukprot:s4283_g1.t1
MDQATKVADMRVVSNKLRGERKKTTTYWEGNYILMAIMLTVYAGLCCFAMYQGWLERIQKEQEMQAKLSPQDRGNIGIGDAGDGCAMFYRVVQEPSSHCERLRKFTTNTRGARPVKSPERASGCAVAGCVPDAAALREHHHVPLTTVATPRIWKWLPRDQSLMPVRAKHSEFQGLRREPWIGVTTAFSIFPVE